VTSTAQAAGVDIAFQAHEQEALLLVELLRSSRLSLLYAEPGADKTALLRFGLMPLLCRRAGDHLGPAAVRASGVVVPFPDRRSRSSVRSSKRRREIVVYLGDWGGDTPLTVLRGALFAAIATEQPDAATANARLVEILDDLSQRFDAHFIVLLDRYEDLLVMPADDTAAAQFANELAEAINRPQLTANFLIALTEEAAPRLAALRARIPGFDDSSLKLAPPREFQQATPRTLRQEPAAPATFPTLPVLTETVPVSDNKPVPTPHVASGMPARSHGRKKVRQPPVPRVELKIADVYAMIEAALDRIAKSATDESLPCDRTESMRSAQSPVPEPIASDPSRPPRPPGRGKELQEAIDRMERRLGAAAGDKRDPRA